MPATRVHAEKHVRVLPAYTVTFRMYIWRRFESPHSFQRAKPHGTHHTNTQPHTTTHTTSHGDRDRKTENETDVGCPCAPLSLSCACACRDDKPKDKMKNLMKKKTEIVMWTDAESKFAQEKS